MKTKRETEFLEFKESLSQLNRGLESLVAMINKSGQGTVYFGIKDDGTIKGVSIGNKTLKDISNEVFERIKPTIIPIISEEHHGNKTIIKLEASGTNTPYSMNGNYFIRSGNENKKIDPDTMRLLIFKNSNDNIVEIESINQDLTFNQLLQLYTLKNFTLKKETFAKNLGLLNKNNKFNLLANLMADNNDISIKVIRFKGTDKTEIISRNEFGYKCLILAINNALNYVNSFNETQVDMSQVERKEIKLFDESSLREAWMNACLHTKWDRLISPAIYIFDDRIEIISNGGLPIDYSKEEFYKGISHPINKGLQKIMSQLGLVEQTGHGVPEIIKNYGKEAFTLSDNYLNVTLRFPFLLSSHRLKFPNLSASHELILKAIIVKPSITNKELTKVTNIKTSRINQIIKELKELKIIERFGANKNGYWKILID